MEGVEFRKAHLCHDGWQSVLPFEQERSCNDEFRGREFLGGLIVGLNSSRAT